MLSAGLWGRLVFELSGHPIRPLRAVRIFLTANLARYVPGKIWQVASLAVMAKGEGVGAGLATVAAVGGQVAALGAATLVGAGAFFAGGGELVRWGWVSVGLVALGVVASAIPTLRRPLSGLWRRLFRVEPPADPVPGGAGFALRWLGLYALNWAVYAAAFWLLAWSFGVTGSPLEIGGAFAAAYVMGYLAVFAPAGLGIRESFLIVFLGPVAGPGPAGALAIASRVWTTAVELAAALLVWLAAPGVTVPREGAKRT